MNRIWTTFLTEALGPNRHIRRMWHNGQRGRLVVVDGNGLFALNDPTTLYEVFFLEDEPDSLFGGRVRVAEGFVGCLLSMLNRNSEDIYSRYYEFRKTLYRDVHLKDADAWERDLDTEFVNTHAEAERRRMEASWPLMELLMEEDAKQMKKFTDNYLRYAKKKKEAGDKARGDEAMPSAWGDKARGGEEARGERASVDRELKFAQLIPNNVDSEMVLRRLHDCLDGKSGVEVVKVLQAAVELKWITGMPTFGMLTREFNCVKMTSAVETQRKNYGKQRDKMFKREDIVTRMNILRE